MKKKTLLLISILLTGMLLFSACGGNEEEPEEEAAEETLNGEDMVEDINLDDFEEEDIIATVNGENILFSEFMQEFDRTKNMMAMQYGLDFDSEQGQAFLPQLQAQTIDTLVNQRVLLQEVEATGIEVTDEEIDQNIEELVVQFGGEEGLEQAMEAEGLDDESLRSLLYDNLAIATLFDLSIDRDSIEITDEEIEEYYAQLEQSWEQQGQESQPLEEVEELITQQLKEQKEQELQMAYLEELLEVSDIETLF